MRWRSSDSEIHFGKTKKKENLEKKTISQKLNTAVKKHPKMKSTTEKKDNVRSTRKLLHHMSALLASMPKDELKKLTEPYRVLTTIMIPRLEYIPKITQDDLVLRELSYFKFCKEIQENTRFIAELNKKRAKGEFLLLAFVLQGKNQVTH